MVTGFKHILAGSITRERDTLAGKAEQQAAVLGAKLEAAKAQIDQQSHSMVETKQMAAREIDRLAERLTEAETERDDARKSAAYAREQAARFAGQIEAIGFKEKPASEGK
jgi:regulator of replication initiation timing